MRVFCHEHKRGFFAPRQSPIKCENTGHLLGYLDFNGKSDPNTETCWQYCCNCEHFSVIDFEQNGLERCPVCTRKSSILYLCDRCNTISFESNTPLSTKNFTLSAEGSPSPFCPGCLQSASTDLREHTCDVAGTSFTTGLNTCPLCSERLDIGPTFPATVSQYLRKTKAASKTSVTFDFESGLFVPVEDGEFVLINVEGETTKTIVIPRSPRVNSARDFYELYQDYYHCAAPNSGEITISEPATVFATSDGWKLIASGLMMVVDDHPKKRAQAEPAPVPPRPDKQIPRLVKSEEVDISRLETTDDNSTPCLKCNTPIESKYAFCWKCGHPRSKPIATANNLAEPQFTRNSKPDENQLRPARSRLIVSDWEDPDEEPSTVQHEPRPKNKSTWLANDLSHSQPANNRSVLKLFGVVLGGFLLLLLTLFFVSNSTTQSTANTVTQTPTPVTQQEAPTPQITETTSPAEMKTAALRTPTPGGEDDALERLREMRSSHDRSRVLKALSETERKYASDYRFPYERAKIVATDHRKNFKEEAFAALARAAQKAINKGQAREMLQELNEDSEGDFQKLSHGNREWSQLQKALKNRDTRVLTANEAL